MKQSIKMILTLVIVGLLSAGLLVSVYNYASPLIEKNERKALREAIYKLMPKAVRYEKITKEGIVLYEGIDETGKVIGYAFRAKGNGYQGEIELMAAIDTGLKKLKGMEVLKSVETPGLGAEITERPFKEQFRGLSVLPEITFTKGEVTKGNEIQAITGATISTRSVAAILNEEIARIRAVFSK
ncbi:MAG: FMN-binding protein [Candidatus Omnitrophota bacterium]|nr:FMN-binding protein [Candidatus Omnitrophota bacterium]